MLYANSCNVNCHSGLVAAADRGIIVPEVEAVR